MIGEEVRKRCSQRDRSGPDYVDLTVHNRIFVFYSKKKAFEIQKDRTRFMLVEKNCHTLGNKAKGWLCVLSLLLWEQCPIGLFKDYLILWGNIPMIDTLFYFCLCSRLCEVTPFCLLEM